MELKEREKADERKDSKVEGTGVINEKAMKSHRRKEMK